MSRFNANEAGTHFWHAHSGLQRADGIFGPIIVHEYEYDNPYLNAYDHDLQEHVITVNDWINETIIAKFSGQHHNDGGSRPNSILINGKGVFQDFYDQNRKRIQTPKEVFYVEQGKRYRFRVINAGILYCPIEFSIEGHSIEIIASDGHYVQPFITETFIIYAGLFKIIFKVIFKLKSAFQIELLIPKVECIIPFKDLFDENKNLFIMIKRSIRPLETVN